MFGKGKSDKQIKEEQENRKANRAPLFEVMEVPENERTESENRWVKQWIERRYEYLKSIGQR